MFRPTLARPAARAYYSSFFSSKPGGGRHFVSPKSPKPVLQPARADPTDPTANPTADDSLSSKPVAEPPHLSPPSTSESFTIHPAISSKEYKLHQFFSLHRPLLLLDQPTSAIFDASDTTPQLDNGVWPTIDNPLESSPEADADAARQLAHALVLNRVGGAIAWQQALSRLGLSAKHSENDVSLAKETAQEWVTIHADSTRRKKRKKMKKHKLKKRRRLTRRQNK